MKNFFKEVKVEVEFDDILEVIKNLNERELKTIRDIIGPKDKYYDNLYDQAKFDILLEIMKKCNLQTIEEIAERVMK